MTLNEIVGQHLIIGVSGHTLTEQEKKFIATQNIGGVILFGRNVSEPKQVLELCKQIQSLRKQQVSQLPLTISIDMEGGRVARLKKPFTQWPPLKQLGLADSPNLSYQFAHCMGLELKAVGINLDYAPVLDVYTNPENKVIGDRAVSTDPQMVAKQASALVRGYLKAGIIPCGKHFPGHGNTLVDSHEELPVEDSDLPRLEKVELVPFRKAFKSGLDLVMTSHIKFPKVDPNWPVTLSEIFLKKLLRDELRYRGIVVTDDLGMGAVAKNYDVKFIPVRALQAGVDILLYCNVPEAPPMAIEAIFDAVANGGLTKEGLEQSFQRIKAFKATHLKESQLLPGPEQLALVGCQEHLDLAKAMTEGRTPEHLTSINGSEIFS
jgi:beta-N-acetylhexosaminidase